MPDSGDRGEEHPTLLRRDPVPEPADSSAQPERPSPPAVGDVLAGGYTLVRRIGIGGMGKVFEATHPDFEQSLAIKVLLADLWEPGSTGAAARFTREAKAASTLAHESVIEILDVGQTELGLPFIVMELLEGEDLGTLLVLGGRMPWSRVQPLFEQLLDALEHAHLRGIIHRDLKPDNCVILDPGTPAERLKLVDFGIARVLDEANADKLTRTGTIVGTPHYMSPEQALGDAVGPASDLYSSAVLLFELLTGEVPFDSGTPLQIATQHITQPAPLVSELAPLADIPRHVEVAIDVALRKDPAERFESVGAFMHALRRPTTVPATKAAPATPPTPAPSEPVETVAPPSSRMAWTAVAFSVVLCFAVLGGYLLRLNSDAGLEQLASDAPVSDTLPDAAELRPVLGPDESGAEPRPVVPPKVSPAEHVQPTEPSETDEVVPAKAEEPQRPQPVRGRKAAKTRGRQPEVRPANDAEDAADPPPTSLPEQLSSAVIRKGLERRLDTCTQAGASRVRLELEVQPSGAVDKLRILAPYAHTPVAECIRRTLSGAKLGQAERAATFRGRVEVGRQTRDDAGAE